MFYLKLAANNLRKNKKIYLPFLLSMIFLVVINVVMQVLLENKGMDSLRAADAVRTMFGLGSIVIMIFSVIFSLYTNGFLLKERKKELGLFNILGMGKKELTHVLFFETLLSCVMTLLVGILSGIIFSKFSFLVFRKKLGGDVTFEFELSLKSIGVISLLFVGIYFVLFLLNTFQLRRVNPLELMRGSQTGEKEPKANWLTGILGIALIGTGYYLSVTIVSPIAALNTFFIAVILVIVGTYALFTSSSILILKLLKANKRFYYQPNHFITVSNMMYRMKQNAMGLASISILCTMVLVTLSSTASLYLGSEDVLKNRNPYDVNISTTERVPEFKAAIANLAEKYEITLAEDITYEMVEGVFLIREGDTYKPMRLKFDKDSLSKAVSFQFMTLTEYNRLTNQQVELAPAEILYYPLNHQQKVERLVLGETTLVVKERLEQVSFMPPVEGITDLSLIVMKDFPRIEQTLNPLALNPSGEPVQVATNILTNITGSTAGRLAFVKELKTVTAELSSERAFSAIDIDREDFQSTNAGFLFLGCIFGLTFTLATGIIIYYKQVSEGLQDKARFDIMQRVGMSHVEVKKLIRHQILMIFFFPLALATSHLAFSMPMVQKLLLMFGLANQKLYILVSLGVVMIFLLIYLVMFSLTSKVYYQLVERKA